MGISDAGDFPARALWCRRDTALRRWAPLPSHLTQLVPTIPAPSDPRGRGNEASSPGLSSPHIQRKMYRTQRGNQYNRTPNSPNRQGVRFSRASLPGSEASALHTRTAALWPAVPPPQRLCSEPPLVSGMPVPAPPLPQGRAASTSGFIHEQMPSHPDPELIVSRKALCKYHHH